MLDSFFHLQKPKKFYITPRFYDPEKEERLLREKRIKMEMGISENEDWDSNRKVDYHGTFRKNMPTGSRTIKEAKYKSNKRLIVLILILAMIAYLYLKF